VITLPTSVLDLLDEGRVSIRGLIRFDFGTGTYGFAKSIAPITYSSLVYQPGGAITVSDLNDDTGLTASQFTVALSASPDDGLTPEVLQTIEAEDYRDRPVTIYDAYFHPDTNEMLFVQVMKRGYVDTIDHIDTQDVGYTIVANCESRALDYTRINGRKRSDLDQKRRNPGDGFFLFAATRGREQVYWGQENPNNPAINVAGISGALGSLFRR
jgi:hypothetical protein